MKALTLNEVQKLRIIEMCNKLFPKDNIIFWLEPDNMLFNQKSQSKNHWFELCLKDLAPKLEEIRSKTIDFNFEWDDAYTIQEICIHVLTYHKEYTHPVDFLYDQFKKFKL